MYIRTRKLNTLLIKYLIILFYFSIPMLTLSQTSIKSLISNNDPAVFQIVAIDYSDKTVSKGSGFFIDKFGTAITNFHVLDNTDSAFIIDYKNNKYPISKIIDYSVKYDLIKFKVKIPLSQSVMLSNMLPYKGDDVFSISYPRGIGLSDGSTVSKGIISGFRSIDNINYIQSTASITHGSSGGGLFDYSGKLVGVTSGTFALKMEDLHASLYKVVPSTYIYKLNKKINKSLSQLKYGDSYDSYFKLSDIEKNNGNYQKALEYLQINLNLNINNPRTWLKLGTIYSKQYLNDKDLSYSCYANALAIDSTYSTAYFSFALTASEYGENDFAISIAAEGLKYEETPYSYYCLGYIYIGLKDYDKSSEFLKYSSHLIDITDNNYYDYFKSYIYYETAYSEYKLSKYNSAIEYINLALDVNNRYGMAYLLKGDILSNQNKINEACEQWNTAKSIFSGINTNISRTHYDVVIQRINEYCK